MPGPGRPPTTLDDLRLTVRKISRYQAGGTTPGQPAVWTVLEFEAAEEGAAELA